MRLDQNPVPVSFRFEEQRVGKILPAKRPTLDKKIRRAVASAGRRRIRIRAPGKIGPSAIFWTGGAPRYPGVTS